jgi:NAD(P)-dependent dehydrogenase (short-subunit alcohol dehydrogenase family)
LGRPVLNNEEFTLNDNGLKDSVAIVTGARRGIGCSIALALSRAGANLVVCDVITEDGLLEKLAQQIQSSGRQALALKVDISKQPDVRNMANRAIEAFGRIDILVNCAGVWIPGQTLLECPEENWDKVIDTNLKGTYFCCQAVGSIMAKQKSGGIINLSSQVGLTAGVGAGAYSISKAGIIMLTKQLALELAVYNIRVNAIAPGVVKTEFNSQFWKDPEVEKRTAAMVPLHRLAETEDIAKTALFLASDDSSYITGEVLAVNGGWHP